MTLGITKEEIAGLCRKHNTSVRISEDNIAEISVDNNLIDVDKDDISSVISATTNLIVSISSRHNEIKTRSIMNELFYGMLAGLKPPSQPSKNKVTSTIGNAPCWVNTPDAQFWAIFTDSIFSVEIEQRKLDIPYEYMQSYKSKYSAKLMNNQFTVEIVLRDGSTYKGVYPNTGVNLVTENINVLSLVGNQVLPVFSVKNESGNSNAIKAGFKIMEFTGSTIEDETVIRDNIRKIIKTNATALRELLN
ncbi:MAG: hypothetical protein PHI31_15355 [Desulfuromonadaceae bacterium]|nr:hypothetical protein [Desulfuromonadaceae bacterium]